MSFSNRMVAVAALSMFALPGAFAANKRCGLGSRIFGKGDGVLSQVLEIGTNQMSSNGSSIGYGTSGCKHNGTFFNQTIGQAEKEQQLYVNANFEELRLEMASGRGEILTGLGASLGCGSGALPGFFDMTRKRYPELFDSETVTPEELLDRVKRGIQQEPGLLSQCASAWG